MSVRLRSRLDFVLAILMAMFMLLMIAGSASALQSKTHYSTLYKDSPDAPTEILEEPLVATVIAYSLKVYETPSFQETTEYLGLGEEVQILETNNDIALVEDSEGNQGWTASRYLAVDGFPLSEEPLTPHETPLSPNACGEYCWVTNRTWFTSAPQHTIGKAVFYAPNVMNYTAQNRGMSLEGFVGGVAMQSPSDIGQVVWLRNDGGEWEGPYLVVDASQRNHMWNHSITKSQSVEVDFETAVRWGMATGGAGDWTMIRGSVPNIEVWKGLLPPDNVSPQEATPYRDFFLSIAELGGDYEENWLWSPTYSQYTNYDEYSQELPQNHAISITNLELRWFEP